MKKTTAYKRSHVLIKKKTTPEPSFSTASIVIIVTSLVLTICLGIYHMYDTTTGQVAGVTTFNKEAVKQTHVVVTPYYKNYMPAQSTDSDPQIANLENTLSKISNILDTAFNGNTSL